MCINKDVVYLGKLTDHLKSTVVYHISIYCGNLVLCFDIKIRSNLENEHYLNYYIKCVLAFNVGGEYDLDLQLTLWLNSGHNMEMADIYIEMGFLKTKELKSIFIASNAHPHKHNNTEETKAKNNQFTQILNVFSSILN